MALRQLRIPDDIDGRIQTIAGKQGLTSEDLMIAAILKGTFLTRRRLLYYGLIGFSFSSITAFLVIVFAVFFRAAPQFLIAITQLDGDLAKGLHWGRIFLQMLVPWPLTLIIIAWLVLRRPTFFQSLLDIFSRVRKLKMLGAEVELDQETRRKIQGLAYDIMAAVREYEERIKLELQRLVNDHQVDRCVSKYIEETVKARFSNDRLGEAFRCTLHIPSLYRRAICINSSTIIRKVTEPSEASPIDSV